jgi:hypothetical protein
MRANPTEVGLGRAGLNSAAFFPHHSAFYFQVSIQLVRDRVPRGILITNYELVCIFINSSILIII